MASYIGSSSFWDPRNDGDFETSTEWKVTNTERINYRTLKINNINTKNIKLNIDKKNDEIYPMF